MSENKTAEETPAWKIIEENCKPYGGFVYVISKCGGTLVGHVWIKSMQEYANQQTKELQRQVEKLEEKNFLQLGRIQELKDENKKFRFKSDCDDDKYNQLKKAADEKDGEIEMWKGKWDDLKHEYDKLQKPNN